MRHHGYDIDSIPSVNYAGMEIDIEGRHRVSSTPLYAECKCYDTAIDSPQLQRFFGKYMTRWLKNSHCHGLFVALPNLNTHAKGFYRENCEENQEITVNLFEEKMVLAALHELNICVGSDVSLR